MDISIGADVICSDGHCGRSTLVVVDPVGRKVTHVVVQEGWLGDQHMVPIEQVAGAEATQINLKCSKADFAQTKPFLPGEHAPGEIPFAIYAADEYMTLPYSLPNDGILLREHDHVPSGDLPVGRGTRIDASDGTIGHLDEFLIDPANGKITHLVLREGHLWGARDVTIPVSQIDRLADGVIILKLNKTQIGELPTME